MDWEEEINEVRLTGDTEHWGRIEKKLSMDGLRGENEVRMDWEEKQKKDGLCCKLRALFSLTSRKK